jgi:hypothetical protein
MIPSPENTINICLGHIPFPGVYRHHVDLMISPCLVFGLDRVAVVEDKEYGKDGSALSEYAQLFWLLKNIHKIAANRDYIRIIHYRRFVSPERPKVGQASTNLSWATAIKEDDIREFEHSFSRSTSGEIFNSPVRFDGGIMGQYALSHKLQDLVNFAKFIVDNKIMTDDDVVGFLREDVLVASCNIGVFKVSTFVDIFSTLRAAAGFLHSDLFTRREGYQRRSVGFCLERLNSYLILKRIREGASVERFGYNVVVSNDAAVSITH